MATAKETIEQALRGEGCLGKCAPDEPVFVLRAQDIHAPDLVEKWAIWVAVHAQPGTGTGDKVAEATQIALDMRNWPNRRQPT